MTALTPEVLQAAIEQLRALEAAGEDPRNANQRWDVTPEQAGALLAHLDDVEQRHAAAVLVMADGSLFSDYLRNAAPEDLPMDEWTKGYETCKRRLAAILLPQLAPAQEASDGK